MEASLLEKEVKDYDKKILLGIGCMVGMFINTKNLA